MSAGDQPASENLVQVYKARDEWEGTLLTGFLNDEGIRATLRLPPSVPPFDWYEFFNRNQTIDGVFVFERDADRARRLIAEFLTARPDSSLDEIAAHKAPLDRERIHELREALREERRTFTMLGGLWLAAVGAALIFHAPLVITIPALVLAAALTVGVLLRGK